MATLVNSGGGTTSNDAATKEEFVSLFDRLKSDLLSDLSCLPIAQDVKQELEKYYERALTYNVLGGKMTRGLTVIKSAECSLSRLLTASERHDAMVLGWGIEIMQAFFLTADDVMDQSHTRRGAPCWFRVPDVTAANAINDSLAMEAFIYRLLRKYFSSSPKYVKYVDLFLSMTYKTIVGQHLDTNAQQRREGELCLDQSRFTMDRYVAIVRHKTAYYSFYMPCALGMIVGGIEDDAAFQKTEDICMELGQYFQIQDDFLDCYGDPEVIGKVGTDIQENKCSWLVCQALQRADESQRQILIENYGRDDLSAVAKIKTLYKTLKLEDVYAAYEEEAKVKIDNLIASVESASLQSLFKFLLSKIYKRNK
ncbi:unnamed protein product [Vitrella brassicaformis CCMP3155]|uniref:Farnesyl pyrophosphate synthase n=2 Tax=Vitrella brassicaformis TaxID=1169539 RepID=A0A0G4EIF1_VITBC|nr:unnamed protein product [Vitrella brassicaformis CCMP3155]|mmetsp:Transcript_17438/g.41898  ORF Transcript_17438/g.41898 Transcript_17438/m.41898 type:complete len:367 (+) Transcript_17438:156-1256(+)|eukprot:CEL95761.1 unnamed protein product [Vitrella brassicaformis CCMP3155]